MTVHIDDIEQGLRAPDAGRVAHYFPALDGVRARGLGGDGLPRKPRGAGGFLGVDVFFVLSGFLITSLLLDEQRRTQAVDVVAFWGRRARRLLPALFITLLIVAAYAWFASIAPERGQIRGDAIASFFYVANWRFVFQHTSYFAATGPPSPLRHMWSLAIEEQYYLVWPLIVGFALRYWDRRRLIWGCVALAAGSALLAILLYTPHADPSRVYFGTDTWVQALAIGSALGALMTTRVASYMTRQVRDVAGWIALIGLSWIVFAAHDSDVRVYQGGLTIVAVLSALLVLGTTGGERTLLVRGLSIRPLRWVGLISYGLYIYHWPMYVWLTSDRTHLSGAALLALRLAVTFVLATVSFVLVERPVRARRFPGTRGFGIRSAALLGGVAGVVAILVFASTAGAISWTNYYAGPKSKIIAAPANAPRIMTAGDSTSLTLNAGLTPEFQAQAHWQGAQHVSCGVILPTASAGQGNSTQSVCAGIEQVWRQTVVRFDPDLVVVTVGPEEVLLGQYTHYSPGYKATLRAAVEKALDIFSKRGRVRGVHHRPVLRSEIRWRCRGAKRPEGKQSRQRGAARNRGPRSALTPHRLGRLPLPRRPIRCQQRGRGPTT